MFSSTDGFDNWKKVSEHSGNKIVIESPPVGINALPLDSSYNEPIDSAFVTSYGWGEMRQKINLKKIGLSDKIMDLAIPFQFVCKLM